MTEAASSGPAKREVLEQLWSALVEAFIDTLANPPSGGIKASYLDVVRGFLKDNGVNLSVIREAKGQTNTLIESLRELQRQASE